MVARSCLSVVVGSIVNLVGISQSMACIHMLPCTIGILRSYTVATFLAHSACESEIEADARNRL